MDPLRRRAYEPAGLVVDVDGDFRQGGRVLPAVMRAEQQLQATREQGPDVSLGATAVAAVHGGKHCGKARRLGLRLLVSASTPELAPAQDDHLLRSSGSALLKCTPGDRKPESDGTCGAIVGRYGAPADQDRADQKPVAIAPLPAGVGQRPGGGLDWDGVRAPPLVRPIEFHRSTARRTG